MKNVYNLLVVVAVIAILGVAYILIFGIVSAPSAPNVFISLTDPANVPVGTTSLNITYDSLAVHEVSSNSSGWVSVSGSGELDLMALQNFTQTLGSVSLSDGSSINIIRLNVSSASIMLNGTVYPVVLTSKRISVNTQSEIGINGTTNMLVDLTPTVVTILTANSTVFLLVPSLRAVRLPDNVSHVIGVRHRLEKIEHNILDEIRPNITLSNPVLSVSGNVTHLSLMITDNSNSSVVLQHVGLSGKGNVFINTTRVEDINRTIHGDINVSERGGNRSHGNQTISVKTETNSNASNLGDNSSIVGKNRTTPTISEVASEQEQLVHESRVFNFFISSNGTLFLPFEHETMNPLTSADCSSAPLNITSDLQAGDFASCSFGYALQAHQSVILSFNGEITLGFGKIVVAPIIGNSYKLGVHGTVGARAVMNVTAN